MKIVAFEGIDGAGKTSLIEAVASRLDPAIALSTGELTVDFVMPDRSSLQRRLLTPFYGALAFSAELAFLYNSLADERRLLLWDRYLISNRLCREVDWRAGRCDDDEWRRLSGVLDAIDSHLAQPELLVHVRLDPTIAIARVKDRPLRRPDREIELMHDLYEEQVNAISTTDAVLVVDGRLGIDMNRDIILEELKRRSLI